MLRERARAVAITLFAADLAWIALAFVVAHWARSSAAPALGLAPGRLYPLSSYLPLLPVALLTWAVVLYGTGQYRSHRLASLGDTTWSMIRAMVAVAMVFVLAIYLLRLDERLFVDDQISRTWLILFVLLSGSGLILFRLAVRATARAVRARGRNFRNVIVVGYGGFAREIADSIDGHRSWGYRVLGFLSPESIEAPNDERWLGTLEDIQRWVDDHVVDEVVFALRRQQLDALDDLFQTLQDQGICVRVALNLFAHGNSQLEIAELDGVPLLTFTTTPTSHLKLLFKRGIDFAVSAVLLTLASPVLALIAIGIASTSRGGILFRQERCGLNGRRFTLVKFRTMVEGAEGRRDELAHLNEMQGPVFKLKRDPRVTPVGRVLRKFSLDELPQLWNVLVGDMSLVGPRPPLPDEVAQYERWQRRRLSMRPGITCLWQVQGRNRVDFDRWMELDLEYIDSWSPLLDLKILLKTIPAVLTGRGAA